MEIIDPEAPPPITPMPHDNHSQTCTAYTASRSQPGHPVVSKLCDCGASPKPKVLEIDCRILVKGSLDVDLKSFRIMRASGEVDAYVLTLSVVGGYDDDAETGLSPKAATVIAQKLLAWASSVEETNKL